MPEHQIRLRGAWEWQILAVESGTVRRVTLPTRWPTGLESPFRLTRRFGRPPFDARIEVARIEMRSVPGLTSAWLNGIELVETGPASSNRVVTLDDPLPARNELVLEVDLRLVEESEIAEDWGSIALVIAPKAGR